MPSKVLFFVCQRAIGTNFVLPEVNFNPKPADFKNMTIIGRLLAFDFLRVYQQRVLKLRRLGKME
jgi:hypothetical protein